MKGLGSYSHDIITGGGKKSTQFLAEIIIGKSTIRAQRQIYVHGLSPNILHYSLYGTSYYIKGSVSRDCLLLEYFIHDSNPSGPLINRHIGIFRIWFQFR